MTDRTARGLRVDRSDNILHISIDRPPANAIDGAMSRALGDLVLGFRDDPGLRVLLVTAEGEKFFCPGWDMKAEDDDGLGGDADMGVGGFGGFQDIRDLNKPIIFAINGICCGGGLEVALSADILIASERATFSFPEIRIGTHAPAAYIALPKRIPYHIAMEMLFTGRWFDAAEAYRWGLVSKVVVHRSLRDEAWAMARLIANGPPLVHEATKEIVRETENKKFQDALNMVNARQLVTVERMLTSEDRKEGPRAFSEKREPIFRGV
jgi:crotonobetainyl-CoA hydratase